MNISKDIRDAFKDAGFNITDFYESFGYENEGAECLFVEAKTDKDLYAFEVKKDNPDFLGGLIESVGLGSGYKINNYYIGVPQEGKLYNNLKAVQKTRMEAIKLWRELGDIPVDNNECIEEDWNKFPKGTFREDIWHWFEENFNIAIADLMCV